MVEALITDCNGIARGKWLPVQKLDTIEKQGLKLPKSALGLDVWGRDIPALAHANGDIDGYCHLVEVNPRPSGSIRRYPRWREPAQEYHDPTRRVPAPT